MDPIDFKMVFYQLDLNRDHFIQELDRLSSSEEGFQAFFMPIYSKGDILDVFNDSLDSRGMHVVKSKNGLHFIHLDYTYKENGKDQHSSGAFYILEIDSDARISAIITIEDNHFISHGLVPFIHRLHPNVMTSFISHKRLQGLVSDFQKSEQFKSFTIKKISTGIRYGERKSFMSSISWVTHSLDEMSTWVMENNGWFKSIRFEARKDMSPTASISVDRRGIIKATYYVGKVFSSFVVPFSNDLNENVKKYRDRSRRDNSNLNARPLTIRFDENKFEDVKENHKFIESMRRMEKVAVSVVHGNPYIYMTLLDYNDGSSFELWVLNDKELVIVPQMRCSVSSLDRLINHVFDSYAEGDVVEYSGASQQ